MIKAFYEKMMIPDTCKLGKKVYKKLFLENAKLTTGDKNALQQDVDNILWQYTFKPTTIPVQPYEDDNREYHEVALLQVSLKKENRVGRLWEMIYRAIPYPLILIFCFSDHPSQADHQKCLMSLADKRFSHADREAIVAEEFVATPWLDLLRPTENQVRFLESLDVSTWPHTHFFVFYRAAVERVVALACSDYTGAFTVNKKEGLSEGKRLELLRQITKLGQEKCEVENRLKGEKNLGNQVRLNTERKHIKDRMDIIKSQL